MTYLQVCLARIIVQAQLIFQPGSANLHICLLLVYLPVLVTSSHHSYFLSFFVKNIFFNLI
jgi:hypothetical protein